VTGEGAPVSSRDRFRGLMAGIAVGDGLGRPVEGSRAVPDWYVDDMIARSVRLLYSDDTVMSMALTESLLECGGFDGADMAQRFAEAWSQEPERGYGSNVVMVFGAVRRGIDWNQAAQRQFGGSGSYGNGGAMRVAPVALWAYPDLEETKRLAAATAKVTHTHPIGVEGAVIQAVAAHHALRDDFDRATLLAELEILIETDEFRTKLEALYRALESDDDEYARLHLGCWVAADKSVLTALYCFLAGADFEDTIRRALWIGGDTDTIAAMAGALAGARWGVDSIPVSWVVEGFMRMLMLADRMHDKREAKNG